MEPLEDSDPLLTISYKMGIDAHRDKEKLSLFWKLGENPIVF